MITRLSLVALALVACGGGQKTGTGAGKGTATGTNNGKLDGMPSAQVEWRAVQAPEEQVVVTLVVDGKAHELGKISAASDDAPGTPGTCKDMDDPAPTPTSIGFVCGGTPAYNYYRAEVKGTEIVVTLVTGTDGEDGSEHHSEVKKIPVEKPTMTVKAYTPPAGTPKSDDDDSN
jgi:hypothetical protein